MKNIVLSAVAVLAMSSFAVAGGDIAPVEEPIIVAEPVITDSGFYLGLAYGLQYVEVEYKNDTIFDESYSSIMLQAGYKINSYIAIEGRYWAGLEDTYSDGSNESFDISVDSWAIYAKPMYPVTDAFDIYALLGYASSDFDITDNNTDSFDGFSWGIGAAYSFTDNLSIFVDYVSLYDDTEHLTSNNGQDDLFGGVTDASDNTLYTLNFGVTYQF